MRLNGWQRLWVVAAGSWTIVVAIASWLLWPATIGITNVRGTVIAPNGKTLEVSGPHAPTPNELSEIFAATSTNGSPSTTSLGPEAYKQLAKLLASDDAAERSLGESLERKLTTDERRVLDAYRLPAGFRPDASPFVSEDSHSNGAPSRPKRQYNLADAKPIGRQPQTLAQMVRSKYPGAYNDLTDQQLEAKVKAKYPGIYDNVPTTPETITVPLSALQADTTQQMVSGDPHWRPSAVVSKSQPAETVIATSDGTEHEFPPRFDMGRAEAIVKKQANAAPRRRFLLITGAAWSLPLLAIYILGWSVGWIRRGFLNA
jgi:hypothetical protein